MCRPVTTLARITVGTLAVALVARSVTAVAREQTRSATRAEGAIREAYAPLPGVRLFYRDSGGSGVAVVFMHPNTGTSQIFEKQLSTFAGAGYRAIAFDRRGWGRTQIDSAGPQPGTAADDLLALMDSLAIRQFHLVGSAAGGFVAWDFALSYPERLRSVVVANSIGGVQDDDFVKLGAELRPPEFNALPAHVRELSPAYRAADRAGARRWLEIERGARSGGAGEAAGRGRAPAAQPLKNPLTFAALQRITRPVLLLTGGADMYAPPAVTRMFLQHVKHAEFVVVPDAGHATSWEQPDAFNRAVLAFVKKH